MSVCWSSQAANDLLLSDILVQAEDILRNFLLDIMRELVEKTTVTLPDIGPVRKASDFPSRPPLDPLDNSPLDPL
eukprot:5424598-Pyramimonas_sp.AAC.1